MKSVNDILNTISAVATSATGFVNDASIVGRELSGYLKNQAARANISSAQDLSETKIKAQAREKLAEKKAAAWYAAKLQDLNKEVDQIMAWNRGRDASLKSDTDQFFAEFEEKVLFLNKE